MKNLKSKLLSKTGAVTIEYVLVVVLVVLGLIAALTFFATSLGKTIEGQGAGTEKTANDNYCKARGFTQWNGGYTGKLPNCQ